MTSRTPLTTGEEAVPTGYASPEILYDGTGKKLFQIDRPDLLIQEFKNPDAPDGKKPFKGKGVGALKNEISCYLFEYLEGFHIPTHFVKQISDTQMLVKRLEMLPIVLRIYNVATGELAKRFDLKEETKLSFPIIEHIYKNAEVGNPWINEFHVGTFNLATPEELKLLNRLGSKVNAVLRALCERRNLLPASLYLEFGRHKGQIVLGDEISPETVSFWDTTNKQKPQRDQFSASRPDAEEVLGQLLNRLQGKT